MTAAVRRTIGERPLEVLDSVLDAAVVTCFVAARKTEHRKLVCGIAELFALRNTMKSLVTGGAGFIGSHLVESLLERGDDVFVVDDLSTGSLENLKAIGGNPRLTFIKDTVLNRDRMLELVSDADQVYHLAAAVGVQLIVDHPVRTIETNIKATEIILELASDASKPVLLTSTSEVYGKSDKEYFSEEDDLVLGPTSRSRWAYASSKIIDEFLAKAYHLEKGLPVVIARLFNTIGPRQTGRYGMVVPTFVQQALRGAPITVYGDGMQRRSFTWVGDVVNALVSLMETPAAIGEVFNIGHDSDISIAELAALVKRQTGSDSEIIEVPYHDAYGPGFEDMRRRLPDTSKARSVIGYSPSLELPEMLDRIAKFEQTNIGS